MTVLPSRRVIIVIPSGCAITVVPSTCTIIVIPSGARDPGVCQKRHHTWHGQKPGSLAMLGMTAPLPDYFGSFFRRFDPQILHHHLQIFPGLALLPRIAQQVCGVISDSKTCARP